jgi:AcrR family transcriptional regulator
MGGTDGSPLLAYDERVTETGAGDAREFQPWRLLGGDPLDGRRRELFVMAAPVFRQHGYRGATIKALAHACGLSPASLYHYFRSKEEMATCLLRGPKLHWDSTWVDPATDPLLQLRSLVDLSLTEVPNFLLALRLAEEIAGGASRDGAHARAFREGESVFGRLLVAAAPALSRRQAERVARDVLSAMVGSAVIGLDPEPEAEVRDRVVAVMRTALVPAHVDAERYEAAMGPPERKA